MDSGICRVATVSFGFTLPMSPSYSFRPSPYKRLKPGRTIYLLDGVGNGSVFPHTRCAYESGVACTSPQPFGGTRARCIARGNPAWPMGFGNFSRATPERGIPG